MTSADAAAVSFPKEYQGRHCSVNDQIMRTEADCKYPIFIDEDRMGDRGNMQCFLETVERSARKDKNKIVTVELCVNKMNVNGTECDDEWHEKHGYTLIDGGKKIAKEIIATWGEDGKITYGPNQFNFKSE
jgi:hypothetical protein